LIIAKSNGEIIFCDPFTREQIRRYVISGMADIVKIRKMICSPNGKYIAISGTGIGQINIYDSETNKLIKKLHSEIDSVPYIVTDMCYSPDSKRIVWIVGYNEYIQAYNIDQNEAIYVIGEQMHDTYTFCISYSPDGKQIALGNDHCDIDIRDAVTCEPIHNMKDNSSVYCLCYSFDSKYIASSNRSCNIKIWSSSTGSLIREIVREKYFMPDMICYSPCDKHIICVGAPMIQIYHANTGQLFRTLGGHDENIDGACCIPFNNEFNEKLKKLTQ